MNDTTRRFAGMSRPLSRTARAALWTGAVAAWLLAGGDVTSTETADGVELAFTLSGWVAIGLPVALAVGWAVRRWLRRRRPAPPSPEVPQIVVSPVVADASVHDPSPALPGTMAARPESDNALHETAPPEPETAAPDRYLERLLVKSSRAITLVDVEDVARIEADGRYVRLHAGAGTHLAQYTLAELEARLDPRRFVRVHRSEIVNLRRVRSLRTDDYRDFEVLLDDGSSVRLSRTYRGRLEEALGLEL